MTQSEIIMKQVALKAAVELTKDKFDPNNDIANQLEVIRNISNNLFNYLKDGMVEQEVTYKYNNDTPEVTVGEKPKFEAKCPSCGSKVWDNRETAQGKQPLWKCGNKDGCDTGKGYPWASWNEDEFDNAIKQFTAEQTPEVVDIDDLAPPF
tara:strand:+ start:1025 stop:1477 length:453 start_codon:yes stop_codon:yes gene_type:complete